jgi:hypothetical protein
MSALPLLVLWISAANDPNHALALDHLAVLADRLDAASYFHKKAPMDVQSPLEPAWKAAGKNSVLAFENTEPSKRSQLNELPQLRDEN